MVKEVVGFGAVGIDFCQKYWSHKGAAILALGIFC